MKKIKAVGHSWKAEWRAPDKWTEMDVPPAPGAYLLRGLDDQGNPIKAEPFIDSSWDEQQKKRVRLAAAELADAAYIGKAADLRDRFWGRLVQSWWSKKLVADLHESRKNWNGSKKLQQQFRADRMECRYVEIGSKPMRAKLSLLAQEFSDVCGWTERDARKTNQPTPAAVQVAEASLLFKYIRLFRKLPPLNKKGPDRPGPKITDEWLKEQIFHPDTAPHDHEVTLEEVDYEHLRELIQERLCQSSTK